MAKQSHQPMQPVNRLVESLFNLDRGAQADIADEVAALRKEIAALRADLAPARSVILVGRDVARELKMLQQRDRRDCQ